MYVFLYLFIAITGLSFFKSIFLLKLNELLILYALIQKTYNIGRM